MTHTPIFDEFNDDNVRPSQRSAGSSSLNSHFTKSQSAASDYFDFNDGFQRGLAPSSSGSANVRFAVSPNAVIDLAKSGMLLIPGLGLVMHSSNSKVGTRDKTGRIIMTNSEGTSHWVRELAHDVKVSNDYSSDYYKHVIFRNESKLYAFSFKIRLAQVPLLQNAVRPVFF